MWARDSDLLQSAVVENRRDDLVVLRDIATFWRVDIADRAEYYAQAQAGLVWARPTADLPASQWVWSAVSEQSVGSQPGLVPAGLSDCGPTPVSVRIGTESPVPSEIPEQVMDALSRRSPPSGLQFFVEGRSRLVADDTPEALTDRHYVRWGWTSRTPSGAIKAVASTTSHGPGWGLPPDEALDELRRGVETVATRAATPLGTHPRVVLSAVAATTFVHEVLGHVLEADRPDSGDRGPRFPVDWEVHTGSHDIDPWLGVRADDAGRPVRPLHTISEGAIRVPLGGADAPFAHRAAFGDPLQTRFRSISLTSESPESVAPGGLIIESVSRGRFNPSTQLVTLEIARARLDDVEFAGGRISLRLQDLLDRVSATGADSHVARDLCVKGRQKLPVVVESPSLLLEDLPILPSS